MLFVTFMLSKRGMCTKRHSWPCKVRSISWFVCFSVADYLTGGSQILQIMWLCVCCLGSAIKNKSFICAMERRCGMSITCYYCNIFFMPSSSLKFPKMILMLYYQWVSVFFFEQSGSVLKWLNYYLDDPWLMVFLIVGLVGCF